MLFQVVVESLTSAFDYDDLVIDAGSKVNADLSFDRAKKHIYVMTERRVSPILPSPFKPHSLVPNFQRNFPLFEIQDYLFNGIFGKVPFLFCLMIDWVCGK